MFVETQSIEPWKKNETTTSVIKQTIPTIQSLLWLKDILLYEYPAM